jgi:uncharacterized protein GlcG (DUF336 family)
VATSGAQPGNNNAAKSKAWTAAIMRALESRSLGKQIQALDELAAVLLDKCAEGDLAALQELGNRIEGKPAQGITLSGDSDNPIQTRRVVELVGGTAAKPNGHAHNTTAGET